MMSGSSSPDLIPVNNQVRGTTLESLSQAATEDNDSFRVLKFTSMYLLCINGENH